VRGISVDGQLTRLALLRLHSGDISTPTRTTFSARSDYWISPSWTTMTTAVAGNSSISSNQAAAAARRQQSACTGAGVSNIPYKQLMSLWEMAAVRGVIINGEVLRATNIRHGYNNQLGIIAAAKTRWLATGTMIQKLAGRHSGDSDGTLCSVTGESV
jgi:hypothetical protein